MNVEDREPIATLRRELGLGLDVWYLRLYYSVDYVKGAAGNRSIHSPEKLMAQLNSDLYDNFIRTRVFNREELDETFSALARPAFFIAANCL